MSRRLTCRLGAIAAVLGVAFTPSAHAQCEAWLAGDGVPGVLGTVYATVEWDPDGGGPAGPLLVVGGAFSHAGDVAARNIAAWDGERWHALGPGLGAADRPVHALVVHQGRLVAGGGFITSGSDNVRYLAEWDGSAWNELGAEFNWDVRALCSDGDTLFAGGYFSRIGSLDVNGVASWDGKAWAAMDAGFTGGHVDALAMYNGQLFAGGAFTASNGVPMLRIAAWSGAAWQPVGGGVGGIVRALRVHEGRLIAGGSFLSAGGAPANSLVAWNGVAWSQVGVGVTSGGLGVFDLTVHDGELFVAGEFGLVGGLFNDPNRVEVRNIAAWNGERWSPLAGGLSTRLESLAVYESRVVAGGQIAGNVGDGYGISVWAGESWDALGEGFSAYAPPDGLLVTPEGVVAFRRTGATSAISRWSGSTWETLHEFNEIRILQSMVRLDDQLYFAYYNRQNLTFFERFDGSAWQPVPLVTADGLLTMTRLIDMDVLDGQIVAAVIYRNSAFFERRGAARFDGTHWHILAGEANNLVWDVSVIDGQLYACGRFTIIGGQAANRIARWDGAAWNPLGAGFNADCNTVIGYQGGLVAGGEFTQAGGNPAARVARWNGAAWEPLGTGLSGQQTGGFPLVRDLAALGDELFASGHFTTAGGLPSSHVARWDGSQWHSMHGGVANNPLNPAEAGELAAFNNELLVSGNFTTAGPRVTGSLARWTTNGVPGVERANAVYSINDADDVTLHAVLTPGYDALGAVYIEWVRGEHIVVDGPGGASAGGGHVSGAGTAALTISSARCADAGEYVCRVATDCGTAQTLPSTLEVSDCCPGDFNEDSAVNSADFFAFLAAFFELDARADVNADASIDSRDFFEFLAAFFTPC